MSPKRPFFGRKSKRSDGIFDIFLQSYQFLSVLNAHPEDAWRSQAGKGAYALKFKLKRLLPGSDPIQSGGDLADYVFFHITQEFQRQVNSLGPGPASPRDKLAELFL